MNQTDREHIKEYDGYWNLTQEELVISAAPEEWPFLAQHVAPVVKSNIGKLISMSEYFYETYSEYL